jgi:hypothetical protein
MPGPDVTLDATGQPVFIGDEVYVRDNGDGASTGTVDDVETRWVPEEDTSTDWVYVWLSDGQRVWLPASQVEVA